MSELYDSIPTAQRKAYEANAAEAAEQAAAPVMEEIGHLATQGAQDVIDEATRITIVSGIVDSFEKGEQVDSRRVLNDMPKSKFVIKALRAQDKFQHPPFHP